MSAVAKPLAERERPCVALLAHCRAGFETECARDLALLGDAAGLPVEPAVAADRAYVVARLRMPASVAPSRWTCALRARPPIFARTVACGTGPHAIAGASNASARPDRITPLVEAAASLREAAPFSDVWLEYPDTNEGKQLSSLARSLHARLAGALRDARLLQPGSPSGPRLHVLLEDGATAWLAVSDPAWGPAWPMGIARLHLPRAAPSRSTLKLAEAFATFFGERERDALRPGMRAVDLGAAPGGWTWQLVQRGLRVTAVDNGLLKGAVAQDPLVTHVRADGLRYRPRRPVDWVTCDIVESPSRIATLMGMWIAEGLARCAVFNLKLPMKKRYDEVQRCRDVILTAVARAQVQASLRLRQLYHDREEVTGCLVRDDAQSSLP